MLIMPKGYKYWINNADGTNGIKADAPQWAKDEFKEYMDLRSSKDNGDGTMLLCQILA